MKAIFAILAVFAVVAAGCSSGSDPQVVVPTPTERSEITAEPSAPAEPPATPELVEITPTASPVPAAEANPTIPPEPTVPPLVEVPYVVGDTAIAAIAHLEAHGFGWEIDLPAPDDSLVVGQEPAGGAEAEPGSVVILTTAAPEAEPELPLVVVPYVVGDTATAAIAHMEAHGFFWTINAPAPDDSIVVGQEPAAGTELPVGSVVDLTVTVPDTAETPTPTAAPDPTPTPTAAPDPTPEATPKPDPDPTPEATPKPASTQEPAYVDDARQGFGCQPYGSNTCVLEADGTVTATTPDGEWAGTWRPAVGETITYFHDEWDVPALLATFADLLQRRGAAVRATVRAQMLADAGIESGSPEAAEFVNEHWGEIDWRAREIIRAEAEETCGCRRG